MNLETTLLLVFAGLISVSAIEQCDTYSSTGCRAPFGLDIGYEALFAPFCNLHYVCYMCGASYGFTKADCDNKLQSDLYNACDTLSDPERCRFQADNVHSLMIRVVGNVFFHSEFFPEPWCVEHGVESCLSSIATSTAPPVTS